jgi:hypothetical protein
VGARQTGVLRFDPGQVCLAKGQVSEVERAQVAAPRAQQVDRVAGPIPLLRVQVVAPAVEQHQQQLRPAIALLRREPLEDGFAYQPLLTLAHVLFGLRFDERLLDQH